MNIRKLSHALLSIYRPSIVEGEVGETEPVGTHPRLAGRSAAMEQISASADALVANEFADFDEESGTAIPREPVELPKAEAEVDDAVILTPQQPEAKPDEPQKPRMVPIVVDGQTIEVDETRIIEAGKRTLQKESAADRRLQEANEILNRARAQQQRASQDPAQQPQAPSQDAQQQPTQATNGLNDPATLINVIRQTVTQDVMESISAHKAVETFRQEFADIASDPYLWQIAVQMEDRRLQEAAALNEPSGDALQAYRKHGEEIRSWKSKFAPAPAPAVPEDKQERKRTITAISAVNAKAPAPQPPKVLTTSEEIERMRQERKAYGRQINRQVPR